MFACYLGHILFLLWYSVYNQELVAVSRFIFMCYLYNCCCLLNKINYVALVLTLFFFTN